MKIHKKTIRDVPIEGNTVLLRADYNVPQNEDGSIHDDFRIRTSLPTLRRLLKDGCKVVIIAHLGRPEGRESKYSLEPIAQRLAELLGEEVRFIDRTIGDKVRMAVKRAPKRSIIVLENLRFHPEEEANDPKFAESIARDSGARYFVQDGFGVVHREHASTSAITLRLPSVAGLLLEKEYTAIVGAMRYPKRPLVAILGGAKVSDKIQLVDEFIKTADSILIGGAMANTFLYERGFEVGESLFETDQAETVKKIYDDAKAKAGKKVEEFLRIPEDLAVDDGHSTPATRTETMRDNVEPEDRILDIGQRTIENYQSIIAQAGTVIWNGTLGYAEAPEFALGSVRIAEVLAGSNTIDSIIGGGDTADFVINWDAKKGDSFTHVSTGGGASLELMTGKKLPGIEHLLDA